MQISLRPQRTSDELFLRQLYGDSRKADIIAMQLRAKQRSAFINSQFDLQLADYRRKYPDAEFMMVEYEAKPVGRFYCWRAPQTTRIIDLLIDRKHRKLKLEQHIIEREITKAESVKGSVEVLIMPTHPLYLLFVRLGFSAESVQDTHSLLRLSTTND